MTKKQHKKSTIVYGRHPILDALKSGIELEAIYMLSRASGTGIDEIKQMARDKGIPYKSVPRFKLDKFTQANHQGVVAMISLINYHKLEDVLAQLYELGKSPFVVALEGVTDVRNLGAIARSVECLGGHALVVPLNNSAQINEHALKSSAGALNKLNVCRVESVSQAIEIAKSYGIQVVGTSLKATTTISKIDFSNPTMLIMGSEDQGLTEDTISKIDEALIIPQTGSTDSLNVSVATGIILYEAMSQRQGVTD